MKQFQEISKRLNVPLINMSLASTMPDSTGAPSTANSSAIAPISFDHRGVHFIALDNVSRAKPEIGADQLAWLKKDLARFSKSAPIVVFTASSALRSSPRLGVVHQRRRRCHECALALRQCDWCSMGTSTVTTSHEIGKVTTPRRVL